MPGIAEVRVKGAAELERAFKQVRRETLTELRPAIRKLATPIRADATALAVDNISNIGSLWSQFRIGVVLNGVYLAPKQRRRGGSPRPNLGGLLLDKAMQPAVDRNEERVKAGLDLLVRETAARNGF